MLRITKVGALVEVLTWDFYDKARDLVNLVDWLRSLGLCVEWRHDYSCFFRYARS